MVRYQKLTRKPELFRAPLGTGTMYPLNPLSQALRTDILAGSADLVLVFTYVIFSLAPPQSKILATPMPEILP